MQTTSCQMISFSQVDRVMVERTRKFCANVFARLHSLTWLAHGLENATTLK
jgi:hypothetical protein